MTDSQTIPDVHSIARDQLRAFVQRVERIEEEIKTLNDDKSDIYKEAAAVGFDKKTLKKVVARRKVDDSQRQEEDALFEIYWDAVHDTNLVHARVRENIEEFDAETGEILDDRRSYAGLNIVTKHTEITASPETATQSLANGPCEAVSERTATQVDASASAEAGVSGQPEMIPATSAESAGEVAGSASDLPTNSEKATVATQGEATAPTSDERVSLPVDDRSDAAAKPKFVLRPHCKNPGETCPGHGTTHCRACIRAFEEEAA